MTEEKKKRGRPKKSVAPSEETPFDKDFHEKGYGITPNKGILAVNADKFDPMPGDWFSMSKIAKLQWLTEHRK